MTYSEIVEERICAIFGVTAGQWKLSSHGKATTGNDQQVETFKAAQINLKQLIVPILEAAYTIIYRRKIATKQFLSTELGDQDPSQSQQCKVVLPGIPDFNMMSTLYTMGIFRPEAFVQCMASRLNFPKNFFYEKPVLDPAELNGVDLGTEGEKETVTTKSDAKSATGSGKSTSQTVVKESGGKNGASEMKKRIRDNGKMTTVSMKKKGKKVKR